MGEHQPVDDRQRHQGGDPAKHQKSDLNDAIVAERKIIQPLHSDSHAHAADRASKNSRSRHAFGSRRPIAPERVPERLHGPRGHDNARRFDATPTSAPDEPDRNHNK